MTVIQPNSISGVTSITAHGGDITYYKSDGTAGNQFTHNIQSTGVITATKFVGAFDGTTGTFSGNLGVGGVLTYEDVTNVDSVGVITARSGIDAASNLLLKTGGTEKLKIDSSGRVHIGGVTGPNSAKLFVSGTNSNSYVTLRNTSASDGSGARWNSIRFQGTQSGGEVSDLVHLQANHDGTSDDEKGSFQILVNDGNDGDSLQERLRIESGGDVSIGGMDANTFSNYRTFTIGGAGAVDGSGIDLERSDGNIYGRFFADSNGVQIQAAQSGDYIRFETAGGTERLRIGSSGQIGIAGANYGAARQVIVSNGSGSAVSWSSNPFLLDMDGLGDIDYDSVFLRYRETAAITGNGLVHLGLCKSTTNCGPGRIGIPVGFIPGTAYNAHFRVDKVGITPWPDGSGHRYEFYAIISDYVSTGKLGIFYLTNSTN